MGWVRLEIRLEVRVRVRVLHQKETQPVSQKKPSAFGFELRALRCPLHPKSMGTTHYVPTRCPY